MPKNALKQKQAISFFLVFLLVLSCFAGAVNFAGGETTVLSTQPTGSASVIATLENSIAAGDWNSITTETFLSPLPTSRSYLGIIKPTNQPTPTQTITLASPRSTRI